MADHPLEGFAGYRMPGYTQIPDQLLDEQLHLLSHAELKVLLYIMRHTFGYKRDGDHLSARQIADGLMRRDGARVDHGTGCEIATVRRTVKRLEELGLITVHRDHTKEAGDVSNFYKIRVQEGGCRGNTRVVSVEHPGGCRGNTHQDTRTASIQTESGDEAVAPLSKPPVASATSVSDSLPSWAEAAATALGRPREARQLGTWARKQGIPHEILEAAEAVTAQQPDLKKPVAYLQTVAKVMMADREVAAEAGERKRSDCKRAAYGMAREIFADPIIGGSWRQVESILGGSYGQALAAEVVRELQQER